MQKIYPITIKDLNLFFKKETGINVNSNVDEKIKYKDIIVYLKWLEEKVLKQMNEENIVKIANEEIISLQLNEILL